MEPKQPERKPFFKFFSREWLEGTIRFQCSEAERGIFVDLLALANESRNRGVIQASADTPYPLTWLAAKLNTTGDFLEQCLRKFAEQGRIVQQPDGIHIVNFNYYQTQLYARGRRCASKKQDPDKYVRGTYGHAVKR